VYGGVGPDLATRGQQQLHSFAEVQHNMFSKCKCVDTGSIVGRALTATRLVVQTSIGCCETSENCIGRSWQVLGGLGME
jgi:hypothetical protein